RDAAGRGGSLPYSSRGGTSSWSPTAHRRGSAASFVPGGRDGSCPRAVPGAGPAAGGRGGGGATRRPALWAGRSSGEGASRGRGGEAGARRDPRRAGKPAGRVIGPVVVGTDEPLSVGLAVGDQHAAMAADVGEGADLAVESMHDDDRLAADLQGHGIAGMRQLL